jgi:ribosomal protein S18 acetylase RimI-like enzyme
MSPEYRVRSATAADAAVIAHHRAAMFRDMGLIDSRDMADLNAATRAYLADALPAREYLGWLAEDGGTVVAGGGMLIRPALPRPETLHGGQEAYILNVYTEPEHRRRGLACQLMEVMLLWCREHDIRRISLHASDEGRRLYESLGFLQTNEMRLER